MRTTWVWPAIGSLVVSSIGAAQRVPVMSVGHVVSEVAAPSEDRITPEVAGALGLYIHGPFARRGPEAIAQMVRGARMNAAVVDFKDGMGRVTFDSAMERLAAQETHFIDDPRALVAGLHARGIHVIGRIVCFSDRQMAVTQPEHAILDNRPGRVGQPWVSWGTGGGWLNPWDPANHDMLVELATEVASFGVDELQLDYIRFPVDDGVHLAAYPHEQPGVRRAELLHGLLARIDAAVPVPLGVDVFGIQAFWEGDRSGLGQDLELWEDVVEVYSPMLYLNAMGDWNRGHEHRARSLVLTGVRRLRERLGPRPVIRPFLQGFANGAPSFDGAFIAEQVQGARAGGADGFLFWNAGSMFGVVQRGMQGPARHLVPFPIPEERRRVRAGGEAARSAAYDGMAMEAAPPEDRRQDSQGEGPRPLDRQLR